MNPNFLAASHISKLNDEIEELNEKIINKKGEIKRALIWQIPSILLALYGLVQLILSVF